ncbi:unnamed protein product [Somion occarium]|uniref:DUF6533 domain-containing protein n=1 Tax=Somion occarium TaxID=3059160 RepID=A0ABP1DFI8_9APHY
MSTPSLNTLVDAQTANYLVASAAALWVWDVISSFPDDVQVFVGRKFTFTDVAYALARAASGGFLLASVRYSADPIGPGCFGTLTSMSWFEPSALVFNALLFLIRVRAVFLDSRKIVAAFSLLWLATLTAYTLPFSSDLTAHNCQFVGTVKPQGSVGFIVVAIFDTAVFTAISYHVLKFSLALTWKERFASFLDGSGLGHVSRVLLQTGQLYYLATVGMTILNLVTFLSSVPPSFKGGSTLFSIAIQNIMACKVFRLLRLGLLRDDTHSSRTTRAQQSHSIRFTPGTDYTSGIMLSTFQGDTSFSTTDDTQATRD